MKERPMLFSGDMVRAILDGRKTQTRRPVKNLTEKSDPKRWVWKTSKYSTMTLSTGERTVCPYGEPGDQLWVRETWREVPRTSYGFDLKLKPHCWGTVNPNDTYEMAVYRAGWDRSEPRPWRPSIHMPRWASRITLEITGIRVERLHWIRTQDACAEGYDNSTAFLKSKWAKATEKKHGRNPWVWVIEFRRIQP